MLHYIDKQKGDSVREQVQDTSVYRVQAGTPLVFEGQDSCRPIDVSDDVRMDGVALMKQHHPAYSPHVDSGIREEIVFTVDDGERSIRPLDGGYHRNKITTYGVERDAPNVPVARVSDSDTVELRTVTEDCEAYTGKEPPTFESRQSSVSLVEDNYAVDGVRIAPTADIDGRKPSLEIGIVGDLGGFMSKDAVSGYDETVSVEIQR